MSWKTTYLLARKRLTILFVEFANADHSFALEAGNLKPAFARDLVKASVLRWANESPQAADLPVFVSVGVLLHVVVDGSLGSAALVLLAFRRVLYKASIRVVVVGGSALARALSFAHGWEEIGRGGGREVVEEMR